MKNKFTIVIPTRNRADVLQSSLKTCVTQDYDNLEIIVCDNYSEDNTREVVMGFDDRRIRYVNPGKRLSMSHNWEFALSHVEDGYVSILGDDDGFLPDAIRNINDILVQHPLPAICWHQSSYFWPNNPFHKHELFILMRKGVTIRNGLQNFYDVVNYREHSNTNPWLYGGFVHTDMIKKVKAISGGTFFHSIIPDMYSGMAIATQVGDYVYATGPFSIAAISAHSNGAAQFSSSKDLQKNFNTFLSEAPAIPYHSKLEFIPSSFAVLVAECALKTFEVGLISDKKYYPDLDLVLQTALQHALDKNETLRELELEGIQKIATKNKLSLPGDVTNATPSTGFQLKLKSIKQNVRKRLQGVYIDGDKSKLKNVYDASILHDKIYNARSKMFFNIVQKTSQMLTKHRAK